MIDDVARRSAARLLEIDPGLPAQVERALAEDPLAQPADRLIDPISLGALIVSVASLGWTIYHDTKKDRAAAGVDQAGKIRRLTDQLQESDTEFGRAPPLASEQRAQIIGAVATVIVASDPP